MHRRQFLKLSTAAVATSTLPGCDTGPEKFPVMLAPGFTDSGFGPESTAEEVTQELDLTGKNVLVTGCNSGLGYETMRVLALRGAHVIGTGRTVEKATNACASVTGNTTPVVLELTDFESILNCANDVLKLGIPLDALICNAGIAGQQEKQIVHGIEKAFLVNYLGHFLLVNKIISAVEASKQGRIVHVSSTAAYTRPSAAGIRFDSLGESNGGVEYDPWEYYGQSKLANALFSLKLANKYQGTSVTSNALHPGFVRTNIARDADWSTKAMFNVLGLFIAKNVGEGAATTCYAASHPNMANVTGQFLYDSNVVTIGGTHHLENNALADRLWEYSENLLGEYLG
ncbi:SDR family NAD(P)-dependent oxidoreductase [Exilibacterium tricleocarpae]|uniref:SDR family NAD(P)-dependent oxidoreductase n=1 Tax=Exilibacterium tricleocarpae TaxID=2591008 RepID=A0A545TUZ0_9GAMM|nr:SDR family NAD(P)-dependent oxidoreductase [Exilibacterium tricleocarpae]TQV81026.1 SDR family NAD(P)-dependent oxidoreductase [Exilibacterium tricleocarpae]